MRFLPLLLLLACGPKDAGDSGPTATPGSTRVRVATWNIESVGAVGSAEYDALREILLRIDADVVGINEVDEGENPDLESLAADLGYDTVVVATSNPFGGLHNAMLARIPVTAPTIHRSPDLSGDPDANDLTRWPVSVTLASGLTIASMHCKSGFEDSDEFRRTIDAIRLTQAPPDRANALIMGDMNFELTQAQDAPDTFDQVPAGMPGGYFVGEDVYAEITGAGLHNGPFPFYADAGFTVIEAAQMDGTLATRNQSGRRIDYILAGADILPAVTGAEIYDTRDDGVDAGLPKAGDAPARTLSEGASDHLPVFIDLEIPD